MERKAQVPEIIWWETLLGLCLEGVGRGKRVPECCLDFWVGLLNWHWCTHQAIEHRRRSGSGEVWGWKWWIPSGMWEVQRTRAEAALVETGPGCRQSSGLDFELSASGWWLKPKGGSSARQQVTSEEATEPRPEAFGCWSTQRQRSHGRPRRTNQRSGRKPRRE